MGTRHLLRQNAVFPASLTAFAATTLLWPTTSLHAEAPPDRDMPRKPIYDDLAVIRQRSQNPQSGNTSSSSPTLTERLAGQIRQARLFVHGYAATTESRFNSIMSSLLTQERSFTQTIASLAPPPESHEHIMPGALYVLVAAMSASIATRNRNILLRATVPFGVGLGAAWLLLPVTMRNVGDLAWKYEEKVPVLAENHMRIRGATTEGWKQIKIRGEQARSWSSERVRTAREAVEEWVKKGR